MLVEIKMVILVSRINKVFWDGLVGIKTPTNIYSLRQARSSSLRLPHFHFSSPVINNRTSCLVLPRSSFAWADSWSKSLVLDPTSLIHHPRHPSGLYLLLLPCPISLSWHDFFQSKACNSYSIFSLEALVHSVEFRRHSKLLPPTPPHTLTNTHFCLIMWKTELAIRVSVLGTSLAVQWLRLHFPIHGIQVLSLVGMSHSQKSKQKNNKWQKQYCN